MPAISVASQSNQEIEIELQKQMLPAQEAQSTSYEIGESMLEIFPDDALRKSFFIFNSGLGKAFIKFGSPEDIENSSAYSIPLPAGFGYEGNFKGIISAYPFETESTTLICTKFH
ncbi:MAG: hypothetical protein U7123_07290 [Potamolinea sp.]